MSYQRVLSLCFILCSVVLLGCNRDRVDSVERNPDGGIDVTITVTEEEIDAIAIAVIQEDAAPLLINPDVDLQPGSITLSGDSADAANQAAFITLTATVQDDAILFQVVDSSFDRNDARLTRVNERMARRFERRADPNNRVINFVRVDISASDMMIVFNARQTE